MVYIVQNLDDRYINAITFGYNSNGYFITYCTTSKYICMYVPAHSDALIQFPFHKTSPLGQKHPSTQPLTQSVLSTVSHV